MTTTVSVRPLLEDRRILPPRQLSLLRKVASKAGKQGERLYLVGGFVRDLLLKRPINDFDLVVEGDAIKLGKALVKKLGGKLTSHTKFKTATWFLPEPVGSVEFLDLITARAERYSQPGALPDIKPSTIEDDLHRRDFTINAIAMRIDGNHLGELLDPLNGQKDLQTGLIRVLNLRSFEDDPTRMLRAVRYEKRYGFQIEPTTLDLYNEEARAVLSQLSDERLRHEFDLIFDESNPSTILRRLVELNLLAPIHARLPLDFRFPSAFPKPSFDISNLSFPRDLYWLLWLMPLPADDIESVSSRLAFPAMLTKSARAASTLLGSLSGFAGSRPSEWTFYLDSFPLFSIYAVYLVSEHQILLNYLEKWRHVQPRITGHDLKARGIPQGPKYKEILRHLRAAWLDGEVESKQQEKRLLETLLK